MTWQQVPHIAHWFWRAPLASPTKTSSKTSPLIQSPLSKGRILFEAPDARRRPPWQVEHNEQMLM